LEFCRNQPPPVLPPHHLEPRPPPHALKNGEVYPREGKFFQQLHPIAAAEVWRFYGLCRLMLGGNAPVTQQFTLQGGILFELSTGVIVLLIYELEKMEQLSKAIQSLICISEKEMDAFLERCSLRNFKKQSIISAAGKVPNEVFFIKKGLIRVLILDNSGTEHTIHFAMENQFIADYSSFILKKPAYYSMQALEPLEVVVMPRAAIEWGYENLTQGEKLGRLIAEFYFIYQDNRIKNGYALSPKMRYDHITDVFPNIHNRAPQHMIASYLGITPVHLSRLKKSVSSKN
jgi:CRP-like cAMP-binding protein